jgi:hypothetical protein
MTAFPHTRFRIVHSRAAACALLIACVALPLRAGAPASAIPSAGTGAEPTGGTKGRALVDQMVAALGGAAWLNRSTWVLEGQAATFYQGKPHEGVTHFITYERAQPYGERVVVITKIGVFIPTDHRDVAEVWTPDNGYEITYKGKKELPKLEVSDFERRRVHSIDTVVRDWLKQPGVLVSYEGQTTIDRHLADKVSVLTPSNDAIEILLDTGTHLPLARTFQFRDDTFHDWDTDTEAYYDYQPFQGIMTPMNITRSRNGEMVSQRFFTKVHYNEPIPEDVFNPDRPLEKKVK